MFERIDIVFDKILDTVPLPIMLIIVWIGIMFSVFLYAEANNNQERAADTVAWRKNCILEHLKTGKSEEDAISSCKELEAQYVRLRDRNWQ